MPSPSRTERTLPPVGLVGWFLICLRLTLLILLLIASIIGHLAWRLVRAPSPWPRILLSTAIRILGARLKTAGKPVRRHVLYLANHLSWLDILAMGGTSGSRFLSKADIGRAPLVGWLARLNGTIFVSRDVRSSVAGQVDQLREALADERPVTMFPEGTTHGGVKLLPFKPALLKVIEPPPPDLAIQPVFIDYGEDAAELAWGGEDGLYNALRIAGRGRRFTVTVRYLDPIDPALIAGRKILAQRAHDEIAAAAGLKTPLASDAPDLYSAAP